MVSDFAHDETGQLLFYKQNRYFCLLFLMSFCQVILSLILCIWLCVVLNVVVCIN